MTQAHRTLFLLVCLLFISACSLNSAAAQNPTPNAPSPTPTEPPPPPKLSYTPIQSDEPLPFVVQRFPRRGEELAPNGVIEVIFDRNMAQAATAAAFTLQQAAQSPQLIQGEISWPNEKMLRFTPAQPLSPETVYDVILTQKATDPAGLALAEPFTFRFNTPNNLAVTQVIPQAKTQDVETNATITVMFNRPVVPLTSLAESEKFPQPLTFDPPIQGKGEWLNTSIYVFKPSESLQGGTTYTARVAKGLADVTQASTMPADFSWQFTTQPPQVIWSAPNNDDKLVGIERPVQITFNQPIALKSAEAHFTVTSGFISNLLGGSVDGRMTVDGATLTFTPTEKLAFDTTYNVTVEAGVTSVAGGKGSINPYSFSFTTVPLPKIIGTTPSNGDQAANPYTSFVIRFNTPISSETVMPHVTFNPPLPITPTAVYTYYSPWDNSFTIQFGAKPSTDYEVKITPGITDPYGNGTPEDLTVKFRTDQLNPTYQLLTSGFVGMYDAALPAKMLVQYTNITELNLRLYQLDEKEIFKPEYQWYDFVPMPNSLQRQWMVKLEAPLNKISYQPIELAENGGKLAPGIYLLEADSPQIKDDYSRRSRHVLMVSNIGLTLKAGVRDALVWATDLADGKPQSGLNVAFYDEGQRLGEATTDKDGVAKLELKNRVSHSNMLAVIMSSANGEGFSAVSENWNRGISPSDFGVDYAYSLPTYNAHIYTDRPIYRPGQTVNFKGIIRQEDDVKFKLPDVGKVHVTVRNVNYENIYDKELDLSANATFNAEVKLAEGAPLGPYAIAIDFAGQHFEQGFTVAAYRAPEFEVMVVPDKAELLRGENTKAVVKVNYFFGGPVAQANLSWNVLAESYQFAPPQFGNYKFYDSDDPYTCFDCWWWRPNSEPQSLLSGSGSTDAAGQLTIELDGKKLSDMLATGSYRLTIEATATGADNQVISGRQSVILHKGDYYIGLSPKEYIAAAKQETSVDLVAVDWAGQRLANKKLNVQIIRYEWVNSFIEGENGGGYWSYETKKELVDTLSVTTNDKGEATAKFTPPQGGSYQIVAQDEATLSAKGQNEKDAKAREFPTSPIRSAMFIWATGENEVSWRRENNDRITLISDKADYAPGETAKILIPSPFQGEQEALVTIERGRIIQHEVIKLTSSSQVYELPITEGYAPNIYVSVVLVHGRNSVQEGGAPLADYKMGLLPLGVTPVAQKLTLKLTPDTTQAEPGQEVVYQINVMNQNNQPVETELSLDLVDKAVLSLMPRQAEAIVQAYYQRRGLAINTSHNLSISLNRLLEQLTADLGLDQADLYQDTTTEDDEGAQQERSRAEPMKEEAAMDTMAAAPPMMATGAVAGEAKSAEAPAPLPAGITIREDFSDTAYWNPLVLTDAKGEGKVTLKLPDNLTTWVMRGVGVTADTKVGEATVELVATKPLLIRPVAPRFFVVDDRAELAANISNNTDKPLLTEVTLSASGVIFGQDSAPKQTVTIPARGESKVSWNVSVQDVITVDLTFAAVSGDYQDAAKPRLTTGPDGTLLVYRYTAPDIVGTAGQLVQGGSRTEAVVLPSFNDGAGGFDDRRGELTVQVDPSLAAGMRDGLRYLKHYEYECTEQTVSRFLPNILTYKALRELGIDNKELAANLPALIDEGLNKLYLQQKPDGGWGWWGDSPESSVHVTTYVVFALTKAKQADVQIKADVLGRGQQFLLQQLQSNQALQDTSSANSYAFMLYTLAEDKQAPSVSLTQLYEARGKLSHYGRAYLALALSLTNSDRAKIDTLLSDINNAAILSATGAHWEEQYYDWWGMNTDTRSTAIILDTLAKLDPKNELIPNVVRWLMVARKDGIWETTQETAWALIAFTDWMKETGELKADYDFTVSLNDGEQANKQVSAANVQESTKLNIAISDLLVDTTNRLTIARSDGNGRLYYSAHLKVYLPVKELKPADRGIVVSRRYTLEACEYVKSRNECPEVREAKLGDVIRVDLTIIAPNDLYYVMVEDPLPAGAEAIDTGLATTSLLAMDPTLTRQSRFSGMDEGFYPYYYWWWRWYSRSELRDEKVVLFADYLSKGAYEYSYTMRTTLPGDYQVIPTLVTEMYFPEVFGRSDGRLLSIGR